MEFLDWDFVTISLDHRAELGPFLLRFPQPLSGYTLASLLAWNEVDHYGWTFAEPETLLMSYYDSVENRRHLLQPIGVFSPNLQYRLLQALEKNPYPVKLNAVSEAFIQNFPAFCAHFHIHHERGMDQYIYQTQDLAGLAGRRYAKKRNLIAQASRLYEWTIDNLSGANRLECSRIYEDIASAKKTNIPVGLQRERPVLQFFMAHFSTLKQKGLVISVDNRPVAFSIYEQILPNMTAVHFEKAERRFKGMYQIINRETAKAIADEGIPLINREEDLNETGLRQTKLSYFPTALVSYYILTYRRDSSMVPLSDQG